MNLIKNIQGYCKQKFYLQNIKNQEMGNFH